MVATRPMQLVDDPPCFPHTCLNCGLGRQPGRTLFIDTGCDVSAVFEAVREGAIYLCSVCAEDWATKIFNFLHTKSVEELDDGRTSDGDVGESSDEPATTSSEPTTDNYSTTTGSESSNLSQSDIGAIFSGSSAFTI